MGVKLQKASDYRERLKVGGLRSDYYRERLKVGGWSVVASHGQNQPVTL
jgi:hypothetical protein